MIPLISPFEKALPIIKKIEKAGYEAYFVGGSVRDSLLDQKINDVDIATSAFPEEIKSIFKRTVDVGIEHGTVMVLIEEQSYEITTFRIESDYQDYRRPDQVTFVRSLKEDLKRRDFTINALAMDKNGTIIDYFNGKEDLRNQIIRAVGSPEERFHEDALRMMRAVRFVSQLDFEMEKETEAAIYTNHPLLEKIAIERIRTEFMKLLLGKGKEAGLKSFINTGLYCYCPGLNDKKKGLKDLSNNHYVLTNSLTAWTLLIYYINLPLEEVEHFLRSWKCSKKEINQVEVAYAALLTRLEHKLNRTQLYKTGLPIALEVENLAKDLDNLIRPDNINTRYRELPIKSKKELAVSGTDLMHYLDIKPGKKLGILLEKAECAVLYSEIPNEKKSILDWLKQIKED